MLLVATAKLECKLEMTTTSLSLTSAEVEQAKASSQLRLGTFWQEALSKWLEPKRHEHSRCTVCRLSPIELIQYIRKEAKTQTIPTVTLVQLPLPRVAPASDAPDMVPVAQQTRGANRSATGASVGTEQLASSKLPELQKEQTRVPNRQTDLPANRPNHRTKLTTLMLWAKIRFSDMSLPDCQLPEPIYGHFCLSSCDEVFHRWKQK
jgi:hypothetical protein